MTGPQGLCPPPRLVEAVSISINLSDWFSSLANLSPSKLEPSHSPWSWIASGFPEDFHYSALPVPNSPLSVQRSRVSEILARVQRH